jgi:hypothetical protein
VLYDHVADVTRTGERSLECATCAWLPGPEPGTVGSRFRGVNKRGSLIRWTRICEVTVADPGRTFVYRTVPSRFDPSRMDSTTWSYAFTPEGTGTRVTHSYEITKLPVPPLTAVYGALFPHHRDMRPHMAHTLQALKLQTEANHTSSSP